jgi:hypothetical protein
VKNFFIVMSCILGFSFTASAAILVFSPNGSYTTKATLSEANTAADVAGKTVLVTSALSSSYSNISTATVHGWRTDAALRVEKGGSINNTTKFDMQGQSSPYGMTFTQSTSAPNDFATFLVRRDANHTGGTPGFTSAGIRSDVYVSADDTNYEWSIIGRVVSAATGGQNVGVYAQGIKESTGPVWGAVAEAIDTTEEADPDNGLVGLEVDLVANDTDASRNRVGVDLQLKKSNAAGAEAVAGYGFRAANTNAPNSYYNSAFSVTGRTVVGFDTAEGTIVSAAFRMSQGQAVAFDNAMTQQLNYDGTGLQYKVSGVQVSRLTADKGLELNGARLKIDADFTTGSSTPGALNNKPGSTSGTGPQWIGIHLDGIKYWIPAYID